MPEQKHIHLIGICGTAMASLAGMLKQRGFRVTGSDAAAYPPMSDFLASLGIPVAQPFAEANLNPRPDLVVVGNAISRGNLELEHVLDQRIPFARCRNCCTTNFLRGRELMVVAGTHGKTTTTSMLSWIFDTAGRKPSFPDRRHRREFRLQLSPCARASTSSSKATSTTPPSSTKAPSSCTTFPTRSSSPRSSSITPTSIKDLDAVKTAFKRLVNLVPRRGRSSPGTAARTWTNASRAPSAGRALRLQRARRLADSRTCDFEPDAPPGRSSAAASPGPTSSSRSPANTTC